MELHTLDGDPVEILPVKITEYAAEKQLPMFSVEGSGNNERGSRFVTSAAHTAFGMLRAWKRNQSSRRNKAKPTAFIDRTGGMRVFYKELVIRFKPPKSAVRMRKVLKSILDTTHGFKVRRGSSFFDNRRFQIYDPSGRCYGEQLIDKANKIIAGFGEDLEFVIPNFVSEVQPAFRSDFPWHLELVASRNTTESAEDLKDAWKNSRRGEGVVVAVLDDGVDVEHPGLKDKIFNPSTAPGGDPRDTIGRDFFVPDTDPRHFDPKPDLEPIYRNLPEFGDAHGTMCAGVVGATGSDGSDYKGASGVAPSCQILAVKIYHYDAVPLAWESRWADAIKYAAKFAHVLSLSWGLDADSPTIRSALHDAATTGRQGKGCLIFCSTGNDRRPTLRPPASYFPDAIAVGACTQDGQAAAYSNQGKEVWVVAPGGSEEGNGIQTTDLSQPGRGQDPADDVTDHFGMTSAATAMAAGVGALMLSAEPGLSASQVRQILKDTAVPMGPSSGDPDRHSRMFGYGRISAAAAVEAAHRTALSG